MERGQDRMVEIAGRMMHVRPFSATIWQLPHAKLQKMARSESATVSVNAKLMHFKRIIGSSSKRCKPVRNFLNTLKQVQPEDLQMKMIRAPARNPHYRLLVAAQLRALPARVGSRHAKGWRDYPASGQLGACVRRSRLHKAASEVPQNASEANPTGSWTWEFESSLSCLGLRME